jgi:hypothetical protein
VQVIADPQLLDFLGAQLPALRRLERASMRMLGIQHFLRMSVGPT